jgi:hypothetical protein
MIHRCACRSTYDLPDVPIAAAGPSLFYAKKRLFAVGGNCGLTMFGTLYMLDLTLPDHQQRWVLAAAEDQNVARAYAANAVLTFNDGEHLLLLGGYRTLVRRGETSPLPHFPSRHEFPTPYLASNRLSSGPLPLPPAVSPTFVALLLLVGPLPPRC